MKLRFPHPGILLLLLIVIVGARLFIKDAEANLVNAGFTSGWLLFASFAVLGAYGLRKKLPFLPIGRTTLWLQLHLGLGLISTYLFFEHVGYRMPSGSFESLLYVVYAVLLCSGFIGWILMRTMPGPMRSDGMELNRSRIPDELFKLREESDRCMAEIKPGELSAGLMDSYFEVIRPYLWKGCGIFPSRIHPEFGVPRSLIDKLTEICFPCYATFFRAVHSCVSIGSEESEVGSSSSVSTLAPGLALHSCPIDIGHGIAGNPSHLSGRRI